MTLSDLGLTARQEAFAYAIASQQHATDRDAAIHAGYGSAGAEQRASENRKKASVTTAIARLKAGTAELVDVSPPSNTQRTETLPYMLAMVPLALNNERQKTVRKRQ